MRFVIKFGGILILIAAGVATFLFMTSPRTTDLVQVSCDGFSIEYKEWVSHSITGTHTDRYFWYEKGGPFFKQGKEIHTSGFGFPVVAAPERFKWFEATTETKEKNPTYGTMNLVLYAPAPDMPKELIDSSKENRSRGYRGFGYFSPEEYEQVAKCIQKNKTLFEKESSSWYQDYETGEGHQIPVRIASIAYVPMARSPWSTGGSPSWSTKTPTFSCTDGTTLYSGDDRTVRVEPGNIIIGTLSEKGVFTSGISAGGPERIEKGNQALSLLPTCVSEQGENLHTFYENWRNNHREQFLPK